MIKTFAILACGLGVCSPLLAQTGAAGGSIRGTIQDPSGAPVNSAHVVAKNLATGFERSTIAGQDGQFEVPLLLPGQYKIDISANGFTLFTQSGLVVESVPCKHSDVKLELAAAATNSRGKCRCYDSEHNHNRGQRRLELRCDGEFAADDA